MSAATLIAQAFGEGADLYVDVLEVAKDATPAQLRKAYYQKALLYHPDKTTGKETHFQAISVAYEILKDPDKRAEYDETGELYEEDTDTTTTEAWKSYFDDVFGKLTLDHINKFAQTYKCSTEEQEDVFKEYMRFKGNLLKMLDCVMLSEPRDTQRWVEDYIQPAIDAGSVQDYSKTLQKTLKQAMAKVEDNEIDEDETESEDSEPKPKKKTAVKAKPTKAKAKKKSKQQREAEAAEELMAKIRGKNALSRRREGGMFADIQERYGVMEEDPLAGEDFDKLQAKLFKKK